MNTLHRPSIWALSWRSLWRDLRAGDLRLLIVAVALAVAALTAVGFFADRIKGGLQRDARQLLGGDAVVSSDNPPAVAFQEKARALGLSTAETVGFPTMGRATDAQGGASKLVALKAVPTGYPLRGQLTVGQQPGDAGQTTREIPAPGEAWVDAPLLDALNLKMGDALLLGDASLRIARLIVNEPDRGAGFMNFAPRVMINARDVAATGLVQPASRVTYRVAVAGDDRRVREFVAWATEQVKRGEVRGVRVESLESGRPEMRQTLDRAEKFLNLVALLAAPAQRRGGGAGGAGLRGRTPGRLRDAARAGPEPAHDRPELHAGVRPGRAGREPAGRGDRLLACTMCSWSCWRAWWTAPCPRPACGRPRSAWVSDSHCWWPSACRRCCSWPRCRPCA
jgi:predicted lysophospholipase L1 biosynthesis ABC-type transport system permease subunit